MGDLLCMKGFNPIIDEVDNIFRQYVNNNLGTNIPMAEEVRQAEAEWNKVPYDDNDKEFVHLCEVFHSAGVYHDFYFSDYMILSINEEYLQAKENPVIVHLTGLKPAFKGCGNKFKDEWWEVAKRTNIYDELLRDYMASKEPSNKEPLLRQILSVKNEYKGKTKTKVLRLLGLKIKLK